MGNLRREPRWARDERARGTSNVDQILKLERHWKRLRLETWLLRGMAVACGLLATSLLVFAGLSALAL